MPLGGVSSQNGVTVHSVGFRDTSGEGYNNIGDFNGDGIDDFAIAVGNRYSGPRLPELFVVFGRDDCFPAVMNDASYFDGTNGVVMTGLGATDYGLSVSGIGDVNRDGFADLVWSTYLAPPSNAGRAFLVMGGPGPWPASYPMTALNGTNGTVINGLEPGASTGFGVTEVGDVNADGMGDFAITSPTVANTNMVPTTYGQVHVIFGQTGSWPNPFDLNSLNGANGFDFISPSTSVAGTYVFEPAGDLTNDGTDDLLIPVQRRSVGTTNLLGEAYVIPGQAVWPATVTTAAVTTVFRGEQAGGQFGGNSFTCDFNGDGWLDAVFSASFIDTTQTDTGGAYVFFGGAAGFPALFPAASLNGANGFAIHGEWFRGYEGAAAIGDTNGDAYDDFWVGGFGSGAGSRGQVTIAYGSPGPFPASLTTSQLANQTGGFVLTGKYNNSRLGGRRYPIGDVNNDGFDDVGISDYFGDPVSLDEGETYVLFGGPTKRHIFLDANTIVTPQPGTCGESLLTIGVTNSAAVAITNVVVMMRLDPNLNVLTNNAVAGCSQTGTISYCSLGTIPANGRLGFDLTVQACSSSTYTNTIMAGGGQGVCVVTTLTNTPAPPLIAAVADPLVLGCSGAVTQATQNVSIASTCAIVATTVVDSATTNITGCFGSYLRTVTVTDACGQSASTNFTVQFLTPAPVVVACPPGNLALQCGTPLPPPDLPFVLTNSSFCGAATVQVATNLGAAGCAGTGFAYVYTLTDSCGSMGSCTQQFAYLDTTPPSFTVPAALTLDCSASTAPAATGLPSGAIDDCSGTFTGFVDAVSASCGGAQTITRTWNVWDACGNTNSQVQVLTLVDTTPPSFTVPASVILDCADSSAPATTGFPTGSNDDCSAIATNFIDVVTATCGGAKTITRTWNVWDACGNTNSQIQVLSFIDSSGPVFTTPASVALPVGSVTTPSVTGTIAPSDNCGTAMFDFVDVWTPTGSGAGTISRTWRAWDQCGNTNTSLQIVQLVQNSPDLAVSGVSVPMSLTGPNLTLNFNVANVGSGNANSVAFTNALPTAVISATTPTPGCSVSGSNIVCAFASIPSGSNVAIIVQLVVDDSSIQPLTNTAYAVSDSLELNLTNNSIEVVTTWVDCDSDGLPDSSDPDDDNDGIPDVWELLFNMAVCDASDAALDLDGDGCTALQEYLADTDPTAAASVLRIVNNEVHSNNQHELFWPASANRLYTVQRTADLTNGPWLDVPSLIDLPGTNGVQSAIDPAATPLMNYRVTPRLP